MDNGIEDLVEKLLKDYLDSSQSGKGEKFFDGLKERKEKLKKEFDALEKVIAIIGEKKNSNTSKEPNSPKKSINLQKKELPKIPDEIPEKLNKIEKEEDLFSSSEFDEKVAQISSPQKKIEKKIEKKTEIEVKVENFNTEIKDIEVFKKKDDSLQSSEEIQAQKQDPAKEEIKGKEEKEKEAKKEEKNKSDDIFNEFTKFEKKDKKSKELDDFFSSGGDIEIPQPLGTPKLDDFLQSSVDIPVPDPLPQANTVKGSESQKSPLDDLGNEDLKILHNEGKKPENTNLLINSSQNEEKITSNVEKDPQPQEQHNDLKYQKVSPISKDKNQEIIPPEVKKKDVFENLSNFLDW